MLPFNSVIYSALLVLFFCGSCKKSDSKDAPQPGPAGFNVSISPSIVTLKKDPSAQGTRLSVELKNAPTWEPKEVVWTSKNPMIASVNSDGTVYAESVGETIIVATLVSGKGIGKCKVVVTEK